MNPTTVDQLLDYWPGHIPFKGALVSQDGSCMCAQGQALHFLAGLSVGQLREIKQDEADRRVAEIFGISRTHAVLLRIVNDEQEGAPSSVIRNPEQILGDQAQTVLAFWWHLDRMTPAAWEAVGEEAWEAVGEDAWEAVGEEAWEEAWAATGAAAWAAARAATGATCEIQGAAVMRERNQPFFFLPLFGFADPESVIATSF